MQQDIELKQNTYNIQQRLPSAVFGEIFDYTSILSLIALSNVSNKMNDIIKKNKNKITNIFILAFPYLQKSFKKFVLTDEVRILPKLGKCLKESMDSYLRLFSEPEWSIRRLIDPPSQELKKFSIQLGIGNLVTAAFYLIELKAFPHLFSLRDLRGKTLIEKLHDSLIFKDPDIKLITNGKYKPDFNYKHDSYLILNDIFECSLKYFYPFFISKLHFNYKDSLIDYNLVVKKILDDTQKKVYTEQKREEWLVKLYVIAYACLKLDIFSKIYNSWATKKSPFTQATLAKILYYCAEFGQIKLLEHHLSMLKTLTLSIDITRELVQYGIKFQDARIFKLLQKRGIDIFSDSYRHPQRHNPVIHDILWTINPVMTNDIITANLNIPNLHITYKESIIYQLQTLSHDKVKNFLITWKDQVSKNEAKDDQSQSRFQNELITLVVNLIYKNRSLHMNDFQNLLILIVNHGADIELVYHPNDPLDSFRGKTLIEIATIEGLPDFLKYLVSKGAKKLPQALKAVNLIQCPNNSIKSCIKILEQELMMDFRFVVNRNQKKQMDVNQNVILKK